jgi:hypothetical protein
MKNKKEIIEIIDKHRFEMIDIELAISITNELFNSEVPVREHPTDKEVRSAEEIKNELFAKPIDQIIRHYAITEGYDSQRCDYYYRIYEKDIQQIASQQIDLRKELIAFLKEYHTSMFIIDLQNSSIDFEEVIDEYLKFRPEIKQVTDEMIEKWAEQHSINCSSDKHNRKLIKATTILALKAMRDNKIN